MSVDFARSEAFLEGPAGVSLVVSLVLVRTRVRLVVRALFCWCNVSLVAYAGTSE
jgi:hypothetical protein